MNVPMNISGTDSSSTLSSSPPSREAWVNTVVLVKSPTSEASDAAPT